MIGSNGKYLTKGLFVEFDAQHGIYTLRNQDREINGTTYPSLYRLYIECWDPTEYEFASKYLAGYKHLQALKKSLLKEQLEEWHQELLIKIKSKALQQLMEQAGTEKGTTAAKFLATEGWAPKSPTKAAKAKRATRTEKANSNVANDAARIGLKRVK